LICAEGARLLQEDGTGETPQALAPRRLPEPPAESEAPGEEINRPSLERPNKKSRVLRKSVLYFLSFLGKLINNDNKGARS